MSGASGPAITRRDFLDGVALAIGAAAAGVGSATASAAPVIAGQTDDAMAAAHAWRDAPARWREAPAELDPQTPDLVVVGAGLSGLAGAWWFREYAGRPARILLLDALEEIGGHARRNEFVSRSGRRLIGYGGSQSLDTPSLFSPASRHLLRAVGVDWKRFETELFDRDWARRHGVEGSGLLFGRARWGRDTLVRRAPGEHPADWMPRTPLPEAARADWLHLLEGRPVRPLPRLTAAAWRRRLAVTTYREFLLRDWRIDLLVAELLQPATQAYFGVGIDATSALDAWAAGLPGFGPIPLGDAIDRRLSPSGRLLFAGEDDYVHHFPDGNAGVARALLRALRPDLLPGTTMEALVDATPDPSAFDRPSDEVRLRLRSTVVGLRHLGPPSQAESVEVRYVDARGRLRAVRARQALLACWHRVVARLTDELPPAQRQALDDQVKVPLVYATVLLSHWRPWQRAGIGALRPVAGFWNEASLDFPVNLGRHRAPASPDEPILVHLSKIVVPGGGLDPRRQSAAGRAQLLNWRFDDFEREIRALLGGALGPFGFDDWRDIEAITVNRWAHGYAYEYMRPWDRFWPDGPLPCETARRGWGRVAIAGADSGAYAYAHSAIDQAARAVQELLPHARLPAWGRVPGPEPTAIGLA